MARRFTKGVVDDKHMVLKSTLRRHCWNSLEFLFLLPCKAAVSVRFCTDRIHLTGGHRSCTNTTSTRQCTASVRIAVFDLTNGN